LKDARFPPEEYRAFRDFLEEVCGIVLGDNKQYLVMSRLGKVLNEAHLGSLGELLRKLRLERHGGPLREQVVEAMTTNETFWFRDGHPFETLDSRILPELADRKVRAPRIWSAACSSGQEPYSISMVVEEFLQRRPQALGEVQILATDISPSMLREAQEGYYEPLALSRGLSAERKNRFFERDPGHWQERWRVKESVRRRVRFQQANLLASYAVLGRFDVIFCRNVLIYFSADSKRDILSRMARSLNPGGYLILGASESISQYSTEFQMERCNPGVVYRLDQPLQQPSLPLVR
jgi:chemotaxis protein methyltransferase CheR